MPKYENGKNISLQGTYVENNEYWGITSFGNYCEPGWVPMKDLLAAYSPKDFFEEHKAEFYEYPESPDAWKKSEQIVLWQWPGADREKIVFESDSSWVKSMDITKIYRDPEGREWGCASYGDRYLSNGWVCLDNPMDSNIPPFAPAPEPKKWSPTENLTWEHTGKVKEPYVQNRLSNLCKDKKYNSPFTDVPDNAWYQSAVKSAYEYGIMSGNGKGKFCPDDSLTVPQAIIMAARMHAYYKYGKEEGDRWLGIYHREYYRKPVPGLDWSGEAQYCETEGLIKCEELSDYDMWNLPATRAQLVHIWAKILAPKDMTAQNTVTKLPDVSKDTDYGADIFSFYEAGIVGGVDASGAFHPNDEISRAQAAVIFTNLIDVSKRCKGRSYGSAS